MAKPTAWRGKRLKPLLYSALGKLPEAVQVYWDNIIDKPSTFPSDTAVDFDSILTVGGDVMTADGNVLWIAE